MRVKLLLGLLLTAICILEYRVSAFPATLIARSSSLMQLQMARGGARGGRGGKRGSGRGGRGGRMGRGGRGGKLGQIATEDQPPRARGNRITRDDESGGFREKGPSGMERFLVAKNRGTETLQVVGKKMEGFDPKKLDKGPKFLGSFGGDAPVLGLPEVCFLGRSNVGKSSMLNALTGRKIAVTSKTPGRTQRVNLFAYKDDRNRVLSIADLPGFGYAEVSKKSQDDISDLLTEYLRTRRELKLAVVLVDARLEPQEQDVNLMQLLLDEEMPLAVVATKSDKMSNNALNVGLARYEAEAGLEEGQVIAFSSVTGEGKNFLWKVIMQALFEEA